MTGAFVAAGARRLHLARFRSRAPAGAALLVLPPFGEEMNLSRRMLALAGRAFAHAGVDVFLPDLSGTGDSEGSVTDATWQEWVAELAAIVSMTQAEGPREVAVLAVRAGALFIGDLLASSSVPIRKAIVWEPVLQGDLFVTQLLRTRLAAGFGDRTRKETMQDLRAAIDAGQPLEITGSTYSAPLLRSVQSQKLALPSGTPMRIGWFNLVRDASNPLPPAARSAVERTVSAGHEVDATVVAGPSFWLSIEIETVPELIEKSVAWMVRK